MARIALFGTSANPPGLHHRRIVEALCQSFDRVEVVPCGPRPDKATTNDVGPVHRAAMTELAFARMSGVSVDTFDLENQTFTRTHDLGRMYEWEGQVWHVVGADLVAHGREGRSAIHAWAHGEELWKDANFVVVSREGYELDPRDLPPNSQVISPEHAGSSSEIRRRVFEHQPIEALVTSGVRDYIERHGLYRGTERPRWVRLTSDEPRLLVVSDPWNKLAPIYAEHLAPLVDERHPNIIVVLGGDGTFMRAVRAHWKQRLPFVGVNLGRKGFHLNNLPPESLTPEFFAGEFDLRQSPLLEVEVEDALGKLHRATGFNDAWVRIEGPGCAWIQVKIDDEVYFPELVGDGVIVSTPAGSTAYAWSAGAMPIRIGSPQLLLVGNNVFEPRGWKTASLGLDSVVEFANADQTPPPHKRPLVGCVDDHFFGQVRSMKVRVSRVAAVDVAFTSVYDFERKLRNEQLGPFMART